MIHPPKQGRPVIVVIGPSAVGKSSAIRMLRWQGLVHVHPTWTTRPRRPDERGFVAEHRFVDDETFDRHLDDGFFRATGTLPGLRHRYGLPEMTPARTGPADVVMARAPFVQTIAGIVPSVVVYQIEDSIERATTRLTERGADLDEVRARRDAIAGETERGRDVADRIFVNDGSLVQLVGQLATAIEADTGAVRCAPSPMPSWSLVELDAIDEDGPVVLPSSERSRIAS